MDSPHVGVRHSGNVSDFTRARLDCCCSFERDERIGHNLNLRSFIQRNPTQKSGWDCLAREDISCQLHLCLLF